MARADGKTVAVAVGLGAGLLLLLGGRRASAAPPMGLDPQDLPPEPPDRPGGFLGPVDVPPPEPPPGAFDVATPGVGPVNPADIVGPWISQVPQGRRFYTVRQGDNPSNVARRVLGVNAGHPAIPQALRCMAGVAWNLTLYGTPCDPATEGSCYDAVDVEGEPDKWDVRKAFLPSHVNAIESMFAGVMPERLIGYEPGSSGTTTGNYGTLWLPAMTYDENTGEVICEADIPPAVATLLGFGV